MLSDLKLIGRGTEVIATTVGMALPPIRDLLRRWKAILIGGFYGTFVGAIPGVGAESSTWIAYATAKNRSRNKANFGKGEPDGILTPEASNNALTGGTMVPMLTLGLPGDGSTAVMLGALVLHGIEPGVMLMQQSGDLVWSILASLLIATLFMFVIAIFAIQGFVKVLQQDRSYLFPFVLVLAVVGAFAISNNVYPVYIAIIMGVLGYILESRGFPLVTLVLGVILGPIIEYNARVALALSGNDWSTFLATWPRIGVVALIVVVLVYEVFKHPSQHKQQEADRTA